MNQKNFFVEVLEKDGNKTYIVREISPLPNVPPMPVAVCDDVTQLSSFFDGVSFSGKS